MRQLEKRIDRLEKNIPKHELGIAVFGICGAENWIPEEQLYRDDTKVIVQSYIPEIPEIDGMTLEQVREICNKEGFSLDIFPCKSNPFEDLQEIDIE